MLKLLPMLTIPLPSNRIAVTTESHAVVGEGGWVLERHRQMLLLLLLLIIKSTAVLTTPPSRA